MNGMHHSGEKRLKGNMWFEKYFWKMEDEKLLFSEPLLKVLYHGFFL
jgi:hypothetical protein